MNVIKTTTGNAAGIEQFVIAFVVLPLSIVLTLVGCTGKWHNAIRGAVKVAMTIALVAYDWQLFLGYMATTFTLGLVMIPAGIQLAIGHSAVYLVNPVGAAHKIMDVKTKCVNDEWAIDIATQKNLLRGQHGSMSEAAFEEVALTYKR